MDLQTRIRLAESEPHFSTNVIDGIPQPEDQHIQSGLGADYQKYQNMLRDPKIRSLKQRRLRIIVSRAVIPRSRGSRRVDRRAEVMAAEIADRIQYDRMVNAILNTGLLIGFSVLQLDWELEDGLVLPRWRFVPQDRFTFHEHLPGDRSIPVAGGEDLDPAKEIVLCQGYELRLLTRSHPYKGERCPKGRFLVYSFDSAASPWGLGLGYSLYPWFLIKREATKQWLLHSDRGGSPPAIGKTPPDLREDDPDIRQLLNQFDNFLAAVSPSGAWVRLPSTYEVEIPDAVKGVGAEVHEKLIAKADAQISAAIIGEQLYSDKSTGSYAAAAAQNTAIDELADGDIDELDPQINAQLWSVVQELNYRRAQYVFVRRQTLADLQQDQEEVLQDQRLERKLNHDERLSRMGFVRPTAKMTERYGDEYVPLRQSDRPLLQTLGHDDTEYLMTFIQGAALTMPRPQAIATLTLVFGISEAIAQQLIPELEPEEQSRTGTGTGDRARVC